MSESTGTLSHERRISVWEAAMSTYEELVAEGRPYLDPVMINLRYIMKISEKGQP